MGRHTAGIIDAIGSMNQIVGTVILLGDMEVVLVGTIVLRAREGNEVW